MRKGLAMAAGLALLAGCSDPLSGVERIGDVPLPDGPAAVAARPAPSETAGAPGFLARFLSGGLAPPNPAAPPGGIAPGTVLPYGQAATVCGISENAMGAPVATAGRYTLWDGVPGIVAPRTHYITGMDGGCAVQFTAALAMFGDTATHEAVRYNSANADVPWSATDIAYEEVKAQVCGAGQGQPCGARIEALGRRTAFVTAYETFGGSSDWVEILVHDGALVAAGPEGG